MRHSMSSSCRIAFSLAILLGPGVIGAEVAPATSPGANASAYQPTVASLSTHPVPTWFRDAKFGIWSHWGPVSVAEGGTGNWYARTMYEEGSRDYQYHVATFGHPSKVGYKDIIERFTAEKFEPHVLMDLYRRAGARYFVAMGTHHDNYDMWDSQHHPWNSVKHGPHKDIVGLWREQALRHGLKFGVSDHLARAYSWMQLSHGADKQGPMAGIPYDGRDEKYRDLYFDSHGDTNKNYAVNPSPEFLDSYRKRMFDLIQRYQPDVYYIDGGIPFGKVGLELVAEFFNVNARAHQGVNQGVFQYKDLGKGTLGTYHANLGLLDLEQTSSEGMRAEPWQTCETLTTWYYSKARHFQKSSHDVIASLVDIVSKNGNLLLNIPQRADGTIDEFSEKILLDLEQWFLCRGESIYGTRPYRVFGEGPDPSDAVKKRRALRRANTYTESDFRYTVKDQVIYAFTLKNPTTDMRFTALAGEPVEKIELLGSKDAVTWKMGADGLGVEKIAAWPHPLVNVFKITCRPARLP